ncbi:TIGR03086 family metal-binding protein [Pseudonocardia sp. TRM90224]|uniref:TIGR03086 family metal-binding protein n=1 Tax=Pseudonocardia sp. TRM90224 TaxID=2812678 RepID=UPI001E5F2AE8|nr:TIGR03086 family metal-binding protein [Pseudonocardia sp. TRM90224]
MDHAESFSASIDVAVAAIRGADPARYDDPSPCTEFTVGEVVSHIGFGMLLAQRAAARQEWEPEWKAADIAPYLVDVPRERWADLVAEQGAATAKAWADPSVWEGETTFGGGAMPAAAVGSMMTTEFAVHGWDVAAATGQTLDIAPDLADEVAGGVAAIAPMGRDGGWMAAEVDVPDGASTFEKALAAAGRDPAWKR